MAFSVNLAPGLRVSASKRGVRTSVGPRAARVHIGAGRTGFSTGVGSFSYSTTVGSGSSSRRNPGTDKTFSDIWREFKEEREFVRSGKLARLLDEIATRQAERRLKFEEARAISDLLSEIMVLHQADFPVATRPRPLLPLQLDESGILKRHLMAAKDATSVFDRSNRSAAIQAAHRAAANEIANRRLADSSTQQQSQEAADAWWDAMLANDPATVLGALRAAFEDNDASAAAVGIDQDEVTLLVVAPGTHAIPMEHPIAVNPDIEFVSMAPIPHEDRVALYMTLVAGQALVTVKEALAVAPAVQTARIIAVRRCLGRAHAAEAILAARLERAALSAVDWHSDDGALKILLESECEIVFNAGPGEMLMPIKLAEEPDIAAVLEIVEFTDDQPQVLVDPTGQPSSSKNTATIGSVNTTEDDVTEFDSLHAAALHAQQMLERGAGIAEQIAQGAWDLDLTAEHARDVADSLAETAEAVRAMRSDAGEAKAGVEQRAHWAGPLPFNRKERFFTGTVFPCLVTGTGFWHIQRLLDLFAVPVTTQGGEFAKIQILTEYGFAESIYTADDKIKWGESSTRDTPDIVIAGPDWLLAIEAKMYHAPSAAALNEQVAAQAVIVDHWREVLGLPEERVVHALLLPDRLAQRERAGLMNQRVVTWEALLDAFGYVGPSYWVSVLRDALERHEDLESRSIHQQNAEAFMTGADIVQDAASGSPTVGFVGRVGGSSGARFADDVRSGRWKTQRYQVRATAVPATNRNWMPLSDFLSALGAASSD